MSLLQDLTNLGDELIAGEVPVGHEVPKVLAALIHWCETGSLQAPERAPSEAVQRQLNEEQAEIARLRAQVEALQAAQAQPVPPVDQHPSTTAPSESTGGSSPEPQLQPVPPVPPPTPAPPAGGQAVAPVAPAPPAELA